MLDDEPIKIYLGIDWGEKRIGLALADGETRLATPFATVESFSALAKTIAEENPDVLVVGKPIKMRGEADGVDPRFQEFADKLKKEFAGLKIEFFDERLTSKAADALPGGKLKAGRDEVAAMILLQNYLDSKENF
jgi:putative holliday junction resolvase